MFVILSVVNQSCLKKNLNDLHNCVAKLENVSFCTLIFKIRFFKYKKYKKEMELLIIIKRFKFFKVHNTWKTRTLKKSKFKN